ncbi:MAG: LysM peptidoglycan-binding domain-containing protein [Rhodothermales bacterium]|nr:LysM peptidoglycan-binding domain-containing protein [Rhodothermales bacterium]
MTVYDYEYECRRGSAKFSSASAMLIIMILAVLIGGAAKVLADDGCTHTVKSGDWLSKIAVTYDADVQTLVNWNGITNPDLIHPGDKLVVCRKQSLSRPVLVPEHAQAWADAVTDNQPDWAEPNHVRFLVAVAQFESSWCNHLWNPRDAGWENGVEYLGSYGCVQIRVRADGTVPHRNINLLRGDLGAQARAAWKVFGDRHLNGRNPYTAWGPANRTKLYGIKLPPSGDCRGTWNPDQCAEAWLIADTVLA